jgi:hypothetical protein
MDEAVAHGASRFIPTAEETAIIRDTVTVLRYHGWPNNQISEECWPLIPAPRIERYFQAGLAHIIATSPDGLATILPWAVSKLQSYAERLEKAGELETAGKLVTSAVELLGGGKAGKGKTSAATPVAVFVNQDLDGRIESALRRREEQDGSIRVLSQRKVGVVEIGGAPAKDSPEGLPDDDDADSDEPDDDDAEASAN